MRAIEARYEEGLLKPETSLPLTSGERVALIVVRHPDPRRWDLERLARSVVGEDREFAEQGLAEWAGALDREVKRRCLSEPLGKRDAVAVTTVAAPPM